MINLHMAEISLDYNTKALEESNGHLEVLKELRMYYGMGQSSYDKTRKDISSRLNHIYSLRFVLLERKREAQRVRYAENIKQSKITLAHKNTLYDSAVSKLSEEEKAILKEYSFKL